MTRLSQKEERPDTTRPCPNANQGCPNRAAFDRSACDDCRRGKSIPPRAGAAALLADIAAVLQRKPSLRKYGVYKRDAVVEDLVKLFGPSSLDKATELTLDKLFPDAQFRDVLILYLKEVRERGVTLRSLCAAARVGWAATYRFISDGTPLGEPHFIRLANAMLATEKENEKACCTDSPGADGAPGQGGEAK